MKIFKEINNILTEKNKNIKFCLILSILTYIYLLCANNILEIYSEIIRDVNRTILISSLDILLNFCLIFIMILINKKAIYIYLSFLSIIGSVNYWVLSITNKRFSFTDIFLIKAATNNLTEIHVTLKQITYFICLIIFMIFIFIYIYHFQLSKNTNKYRIFMVTFLFIICCSIVYQVRTDNFWSYQINTSKYLYSEPYYIIEEFSYLKKPENYETNLKKIKKLEETDNTKSEKSSPVIIQIMSEALADFDSVDYMSYTRSLKTGMVKTNIWGNKTIVSELESLTGISTNVLGVDGTRIYNSKLNRNMDSIPSILNKNGYKTIGVHPYLSSSYNRNSTWDTFGFDETYFSNTFKNPSSVRGFISDQEFFDKIIDLVDKNKNTPLYIYGVSMQNHAGFNDKDFKETVSIGSKELNQYISLENITDNAFKNFIEKLKKENREVILLYYGDHQPMLSDNDYTQLKVKNKYETPYVLWSNKRLLKNPKNTKMCYLPTLLLENANISENAWFDNLKELKNTKSNLSKNELYKSWCYYQLKK